MGALIVEQFWHGAGDVQGDTLRPLACFVSRPRGFMKRQHQLRGLQQRPGGRRLM